jgi:hypothetical protein
VQNCAQNGRKCTLFHPKTHFFAHFCRGEGRLFGRGFLGVFGVWARRARDTFCVTFFASEKRPTPSNRVRSQKSHASLTKRTANVSMRGIKIMISAMSVLTNAPNRTRYVVEGNDFRGLPKCRRLVISLLTTLSYLICF